MTDAFETWANQEIKRLRAQSDELERTLKAYLAARPPGPVAVPAPATNGHVPVERYRSVAQRAVQAPPARAAAGGPEEGTKVAKLVAFIAEAGPAGRTLEEIYKFGFDTNLITKKTQGRTMVWHSRQRGYLEKRGGRNDGRFFVKEAHTN